MLLADDIGRIKDALFAAVPVLVPHFRQVDIEQAIVDQIAEEVQAGDRWERETSPAEARAVDLAVGEDADIPFIEGGTSPETDDAIRILLAIAARISSKHKASDWQKDITGA